MHVIPIDRPGMNNHLMGNCRLPQQFPASQPNVPTKHGMTVLRHPHKVIFAVPNGMAATLVRFHPLSLPGKRRYPTPLKAVGFPDPLSGTLKLSVLFDFAVIPNTPYPACVAVSTCSDIGRNATDIEQRLAGGEAQEVLAEQGFLLRIAVRAAARDMRRDDDI